MKDNLSFCIVTKNNEETLSNCIESFFDICRNISYIDMGSTDKTVSILEKYKGKKFKKIGEDFASNKNYLINNVKKDWLFFIEPNETIINGKKEILDISNKNEGIYNVLLLNNEILSKSTRFFCDNKIKFENPIFETIYSKSSSSNIILKELSPIEISDEHKQILKWKSKEPLKTQPLYYESCFYIKNKKWEDFIKTAEKYLFMEKDTNLPSYIMIKYYLSLILFYTQKDIKKAIQTLAFCIEKNPTMSEFWCLLGDINFEMKKYQKAYYFYDNAIILGSQRLNGDELPIDVKKYKEYPDKMKIICKDSIDKI
jgi:glycosyltransferase involved in cell wall biosynthesis